MELTPEKILQLDFTLIEKVDHSDFNTFLSKHSWNSLMLKSSYYLLVLIFFILTIGLILKSDHSIIQRVLFSGLGVLMAFLIIPIHELIHYIVYKFYGARNVKITSYLSRGYILTKADQFVVDKNQMTWIASAPFVFISSFGIIPLFILTDLWQISICAMILFHATLCFSDFRILDYFLKNESEIYKYDDIREGASYFYKR